MASCMRMNIVNQLVSGHRRVQEIGRAHVLQSHSDLVCRLLLEKKKKQNNKKIKPRNEKVINTEKVAEYREEQHGHGRHTDKVIKHTVHVTRLQSTRVSVSQLIVP